MPFDRKPGISRTTPVFNPLNAAGKRVIFIQTIKDEIKTKILAVAREEFLEHEFEGASIRKIADRAGTSKSNIYNYFSDKDALFCAIVEPTVTVIDHAIGRKREEYAEGVRQAYSFEGQKKIIEIVMTFVHKNKEDFILLLYKSRGSSLASFKEKIKKVYADMMMEWLSLVPAKNEISGFFVEAVAEFYMNTISQVITEERNAEQRARYFDEFLSFVYGGWERILRRGEEYE